MSNFATLKKSSSTLDRLTKEIEKVNSPASDKKSGDDRFWKLERDKSGNGAAVIRFLPSPAVDGDDARRRFRCRGGRQPAGRVRQSPGQQQRHRGTACDVPVRGRDHPDLDDDLLAAAGHQAGATAGRARRGVRGFGRVAPCTCFKPGQRQQQQPALGCL